MEIRLSERRIDGHGSLEQFLGVRHPHVRRRRHAFGVQTVGLEGRRRDVRDVAHIRRIAEPHDAADLRRELIDERKDIGAAHGLRSEHAAGRKIFDLRVDANLRACVEDAADDNGPCARSARDVCRLRATERRQVRLAALAERFEQAPLADDLEAARLREPCDEHVRHAARQPRRIGLRRAGILEVHDGDRRPPGSPNSEGRSASTGEKVIRDKHQQYGRADDRNFVCRGAR